MATFRQTILSKRRRPGSLPSWRTFLRCLAFFGSHWATRCKIKARFLFHLDTCVGQIPNRCATFLRHLTRSSSARTRPLNATDSRRLLRPLCSTSPATSGTRTCSSTAPAAGPALAAAGAAGTAGTAFAAAGASAGGGAAGAGKASWGSWGCLRSSRDFRGLRDCRGLREGWVLHAKLFVASQSSGPASHPRAVSARQRT